jgi:hypothetical protein
MNISKLAKQVHSILDPEERETAKALLEQLGISIPEPKDLTLKKTPGISTLKSYNNTVTITCECCRSIQVKRFVLESIKTNGIPHLQSTPVDAFPEKLHHVETSYKKPLCPNCRDYLSSLSKEDLINQIILLRQL